MLLKLSILSPVGDDGYLVDAQYFPYEHYIYIVLFCLFILLFEMLNEVLIEVYGPSRVYFFDEIQNVEKFETFVRRLQDEGKKVVITGSNASLLSKEFGTRLTGRYKSFEVYPFSFREFLTFKKISLEKGKVKF